MAERQNGQRTGLQGEEIRLSLKIQGPDLDKDEVVVTRNGLRVGRTDDNNLALRHREISRQHMRIAWRDDDKFTVEDLNSSNGVWLNETRLVPRIPVELGIGDVIRLGPFLIRVDSYVYHQPQIIPRPNIVEDASDVLPPVPARAAEYLPGIPRDRSNWLTFLPEIYQQDEFLGRYLLIFESMFNPIWWVVDNFDMYISPEVAPQEWLQWMASWFDLLLLEDLPIDTQRRIMDQLGWLFMRRGTPAGLSRMLELYFGVTPEIIEDDYCHFEVILPLSESDSNLTRDVAERIIDSQRPAFASYDLRVT
jgi:phage tail-like protein